MKNTLYKRKQPFTQIANKALRDPKITAKAKGILAYLLSHESGQKITTQYIIRAFKDGRDSIKSGIRELVEAGYVTRNKQRDENGRFIGYIYFVTDEREEVLTGADETGNGNTIDGNTIDGGPTTKNTNKKEEVVKRILNKEDVKAKTDVLADLDFEQVWNLYANKKKKARALARWKRLTSRERQLALEHIPKFVQATPEVQYRPYLDVYLNQKRWMDEELPGEGQNANTERKVSLWDEAGDVSLYGAKLHDHVAQGKTVYRLDEENNLVPCTEAEVKQYLIQNTKG